MKTLLLTVSLISAFALSSPAVFAGEKYHSKHNRHTSSFEDTARVTHVEPIYTTVQVATPRRECSPRSYRQNNYQHKSYTSTIAGTIVGGVIGNQFGGGSGKKIMTAAGALLGGSVGRDLSYKPSHSSDYRYGEECHVSQRYHQEERINGYYVTYRYRGQSYTTEMDRHPGKRIPVEVSVRPSRNYY